MKKIFVAIASLLMLSSCATTPKSDEALNPVATEYLLAYQSPPHADYGTIIVKRDSGFLGAGCRDGIFVDGKLAVKIGVGEIAKLYVPVGEHLIGKGAGTGLCGGGMLEQSVVIENGVTRRFRISGDLGSGFHLAPTSQ